MGRENFENDFNTNRREGGGIVARFYKKRSKRGGSCTFLDHLIYLVLLKEIRILFTS